MARNRTTTGKVAVIGAAILLSFGGVGIKVVDADPFTIAGIRSAFAVPVFLLLVGRKSLFAPLCRWEIAGSAAYFLTILSAVAATKLTTAANAIMLEYAAPLWLIAISWAFRTRDQISAKDIAFSVICVASLGLLFADQGEETTMLGNVLGIFTGFSLAFFTFAIRQTAQHRVVAPVRIVLIGHLLVVITSMPQAVSDVGSLATQDFIVLCALGFFQIGIADWLYTVGVSRIGAMEATLLTMLDPILNPLIVAVVVGETPGTFAIWGGSALVLSLIVKAIWDSASASRCHITQEAAERPRAGARQVPQPVKKVGVIGGMGPAASAHFYELLVRIAQKRFGAQQDNEFPEVFLHSIGLAGFDESGISDRKLVESQLLESVSLLNMSKADLIVIPCNTVHCLHRTLQQNSQANILSIVDETANRLVHDGISNVAIVASETTRRERLYDAVLERHGLKLLHVSGEVQSSVTNIILAGMCGAECKVSRARIRREIARLEKLGAEAVLLGCTELPLVLNQSDASAPLYDSSSILALATLQCAYGLRRPMPIPA